MNKIRNLKFFGLVCILAFTLVFIGFHFLQAQVEKKDKPPGKGKPAPEPNPLIELKSGDIITTESNALRVWDYDPSNPIWSTDTPGYTSVAVGDADNDSNDLEIVVPGSYKVKVGKGKEAKSYLKIFLDVYKEEKSGIWKSTEDYETDDGIKGYFYEDEPYSPTEVMIADVDSSPGNEVILLTYHNLAVFKYDGINFEIVNSINPLNFPVNDRYLFYAVTAGDVYPEDDPEVMRDEILVSARKDGKGYVLIYDGNLNLPPQEIPVLIDNDPNIFLGRHSLRVADLDDDGVLEICSTGYNATQTVDGLRWKPYVIVWDWDGESWESTEEPLPGWEGEPKNSFPYVYLDAGELDDLWGDDIVVSANYPPDSSYYQLILYNYNVSSIITQPFYTRVQARIVNVEIGDVNEVIGNEIVVAGRANWGTGFYLEVFTSSLGKLWKRIGEHRKEGSVLDTAIVKK